MSYRRIRPRRAGSIVKTDAARRGRKGRRLSLEALCLEARTLLSFTLPQVTAAYDSATAVIGTAKNTAAIVDQVLGVNALPLANQTLDQGLGLAADFLTPFQTILTQNTNDWTNTVEPELISAGFSIVVPFTGNLGGINNGLGSNNLLEVAWSRTLSTTDPIQILGQTGFSYLDGAGGGLFGGITATGSATVTLTMGVDYNATSKQIGFYVAPGNNVVQAGLTGSTAAGGLSGTLDIGDLASVSATATGSVTFNGSLNLLATAADPDGKLRTSDLTSNLSKAVTGGVNGSATVNVSKFDAQLFGLPDITWSGVISTSVLNNAIKPEVDNLVEPSASSLLSSLGSSLFSLGDGIPVLGSLSNTLNQPLPLIGQSIAQLTGLDRYLPSLPSLPSGFSNFNGSYSVAGGTLTVNVTPTTIDEFLKGQDVSLVSWQTSGDVNLLNEDIDVPILSIGVPDIASVELDATFGIHASLEYHLGFGLDGHGFYALAGTPTDPTLGLSFGVTAGVQGQVEVFGLPLAEAGGDIGFSVTPYVALTAAPTSVDPNSDPSKVYMSDLALFGKDPFTDIVDDLSAGIEGDFTGDLYASIDLLFFSLSWNWGISIPVFNYERAPTWPAPTGSGPGQTPWPNVTKHGTVVTFNGTAAADNVTLTQGANNTLTIGWANAPSGYATSETFTGVTSFVFDGGSGADTLTAAPGLTTPVRAIGGSGADTFDLHNSSANNTLVAGTGVNNLHGGSGDDLIIGGKGSDTLTADSGTDTLYGGSGNATVNLGSGHDAFYGGKGNYTIQGGSGTYTIDGGTGSDVINAGTGSHNTIYGGSAGKNRITGASGGYDTIYGGGAGDTIIGGGGHDTIYASAGTVPGSVTNNVITGGPLGSNLIFGGGGGDFLAGGIGGNNTIYAGTGNETLAGGDGLGLVVNPQGNGLIDAAGDGLSTGNNTLIGGSGKDTLYGDSSGHNVLQAGPGNDILYAGSGGDLLVAGLGTDALYGSIGNDTFQLPFTPSGQSQPKDTLVGGGGADTLVLKAESGSGADNLNVTASAIPSATATSVTVSNGLAVAADLPANGTGLVIQIGSEQMLVTKVTGNVLTVQRGYGGTMASAHGNNAVISLPPISLTASAIPDATTTSVTVSNGLAVATDLPASGTGLVIQIGSEQMLVTKVTGNTLTVRRGYGGTTASAHGVSTIVLAPISLTASAVADAITTSVTVSNGPAVAASLPANGSGLVIQIGSEQMLVTKVTGNVLTVQRGYNGTTAAPHGNNALVLLPDTISPLAAPNDYQLYLNQAGAANQYTATLSTLRFATTAAGSKTVTGIDSTVGLAVGQAVSGPGVPTGTTIAAIVSSTSITLSNAATLSQGHLPLSFGTVGGLTLTLPGDIPNIQLEAGPGNNFIQVDPSVTRDVTIYGGPGYNVLMAGSGNDTLIAGPGTAVLYGGTGDDILYGGDLASQDAPPTPGSDPSLTVANTPRPVEGNDTLIAGPGSDELFAGSGNDLLIGGSVARQVNPTTGTPGVALLQNGQFQLIDGAGRDILVGGAGNDVLIAGPGGPGAVMEAGTGNNSLIAQNYGVNTLSGGSTGHSLLLGGNLENFEISNSAAGGGNTLVGGLGIDNLQAGAGNDVLYASYSAAAWSQGEAAAAAVGVHVVPPQLFQGDSTASQLQALLQAQQSGPLTQAQQNQLISLLRTEFDALTAEEAALNTQVSNDIAIPNLGANPTLTAQLIALATQDQIVQLETTVLLNQILSVLGAAGIEEDRLIGGSGTDTYYGNIHGATWMGGGTGNQTFYNDNASDTIQGNSTGVNTLVLQDYQGNNTITLSQDAKNVNAMDFTVNGQTLLVGDTGSVSGIQNLAVQLGSGNDTLTVNSATLPAGLISLEVLCGTGNDVVDATKFNGNETLTGGSGNDVIKAAVPPGHSSLITGTPTTEIDLVDINDDGVTLNTNGLKVGSFNESLSQFGDPGKLVVMGGPGNDTFNMDVTIPNLVLQGGSGSNQFTVTGGTATLVGGSGSNSFTLDGPGNYTVSGNGSSNTLTMNFADNTAGDTITLSQSGQLIMGTGTIGGQAIALTATNLSQIAINGGSGNGDRIDASRVDVPTTLYGGLGSNDTLAGGYGNDTIYYRIFSGETISEAGGQNEFVYVPTAYGDAVGAGFISYNNYFAYSEGQAGFIGPVSMVFGPNDSLDIATFGVGGLNQDGSYIPPTTVSPLVQPATQALTPGASAFTASGPSTIFTLQLSDPNGTTVNDPNGTTERELVNWGDGSTSAGTDAAGSGGAHTLTSTHIFAQYGPHTVGATVIDSQYAPWLEVINTFTGGLRLDGTNLDNYSSATTFTKLDTGVSSYVVSITDQAVFALTTSGGLVDIPSGGSPQTIDASGDQAIAAGPDGALYVLHSDGTLYSAPSGSFTPVYVEGGVRSIAADAAGDLYKLYASGVLSVMPFNTTSWTTSVLTNVKSISPSGTGINVLTNVGVDWQFQGVAGTLIAGPHLAFTHAASVTAGTATSVTLSVLDVFNHPVLGYTGTVTLSDSDAPAVAAGDGPPHSHTFTAADHGAISFPVTFFTSGTETLTAADNGGLMAAATLTVNAGHPTQFSLNAQPAVVGTSVPITVTAYDAYGNVATGFTGSVTLTPVNPAAASPVTYTYTTADQGAHIFSVTFSVPGGQKLVATGGGLAGDGSVLVSPAPYSLSKSTVSVTPSSVAAGGQVAVTLIVRDALGNQETSGGLTVAFTLAAGSTSGGNFGPTVDNGDGTYTAIFTAGTIVGLDNLSATIDGAAVTSSPASLAVTSSTSTATASVLKSDATTQGSWVGTYGAQADDIVGGPSSLPSTVTVTLGGQTTYTWTTTSTDPRALRVPGSTNRVAAAWYSSTSFTVDVNLTDGQAHDLELYFLDWDKQGRGEQVQISDAASRKVLDTETISSFGNGVYLDWKVSGNLVITVTRQAGPNAVLNGLFLDAAPSGAALSLVESPPHGDAVTPSSTIGATSVGLTNVTASGSMAGGQSVGASGGRSSGDFSGTQIATALGILPDGGEASLPTSRAIIYDRALEQLLETKYAGS